MNLIKTKSDLDEFFDKEKFVKDTCLQIAKDLGGLVSNNFHIQIDFDEDVLSDLKRIVASVLEELNMSEIQQFLYRVDLNEQKMMQLVTQKNDYLKLAEEVIIREAQKVFLRSRFKS